MEKLREFFVVLPQPKSKYFSLATLYVTSSSETISKVKVVQAWHSAYRIRKLFIRLWLLGHHLLKYQWPSCLEIERITVFSQKHYLICPFTEKRSIQIERNHIKPFVHTGCFQFLFQVVSSHHFLCSPYIKLFDLLIHNQAHDIQAWTMEPGTSYQLLCSWTALCMRPFVKTESIYDSLHSVCFP